VLVTGVSVEEMCWSRSGEDVEKARKESEIP
jgi:hypothetical protein